MRPQFLPGHGAVPLISEERCTFQSRQMAFQQFNWRAGRSWHVFPFSRRLERTRFIIRASRRESIKQRSNEIDADPVKFNSVIFQKILTSILLEIENQRASSERQPGSIGT